MHGCIVQPTWKDTVRIFATAMSRCVSMLVLVYCRIVGVFLACVTGVREPRCSRHVAWVVCPQNGLGRHEADHLACAGRRDCEPVIATLDEAHVDFGAETRVILTLVADGTAFLS